MPLLLCKSGFLDFLETFSEEHGTHLVAWENNHLYLKYILTVAFDSTNIYKNVSRSSEIYEHSISLVFSC